MIHILYNIILGIASPIVSMLGVFSNKVSVFNKGRKHVFEQLAAKLGSSDRVIWFHAASLGEFEQARPLIDACRNEFKNHKILLTFFSASGYEIQENYANVDFVSYLPIDTSTNVKKFLNIIEPELAVFIKYEFWPNYFTEMGNRKIPLISVSSIFRTNQLFFKWYGKEYRKLLLGVHHFFVQNEHSKNLLETIGVKNITVSGDTRLDRVYELLNQDNQLEKITHFVGNQLCFVAGSTWEEDYNLINDFLTSSKEIKIIIAPHEVNEKSIKALEKKIKVSFTKWSTYDLKSKVESNILIIDTIGQLTKIYSYASFAYVGGGMGNSGLHNTLEPAVYGIPIIIGKNYKQFQEVVNLIENKGVVSVEKESDFNIISNDLINNKELRNKFGNANSNYVVSNKGATPTIIKFVKPLLC
jgi:3-deoxy-D-manno-octulosonic-acid transferase|tara:strand:+ start:188 stop:1429 length:1242 start_codon:yes stop_codon:yes gene_type:complete